LSNALLWVAGFLGGALIPAFLLQQTPVLAALSRLVPQYWATTAYYDILARGASLVDVLPNLGMLLIFSAVVFFIACAALNLNNGGLTMKTNPLRVTFASAWKDIQVIFKDVGF